MKSIYKGETSAQRASQIYGGKTPGVKYLKEEERLKYLIRFGNNGKIYTFEGNVIDTNFAMRYDIYGERILTSRGIFIIDTEGSMYLNSFQEVGRFHHSSFVSGHKVVYAGEIKVRNGKIVIINNRSGHYQTPINRKKYLEKYFKDIFNENTPNIKYEGIANIKSKY